MIKIKFTRKQILPVEDFLSKTSDIINPKIHKSLSFIDGWIDIKGNVEIWLSRKDWERVINVIDVLLLFKSFCKKGVIPTKQLNQIRNKIMVSGY